MSSLHTLTLAWPRQLAAGWPRVQRWLIPGSILLFAALIGWQLAGLFWHAVGTETVWQPPRISTGSHSSQPSAQIDLDAISEAKLFGTAEANLATQSVTDAPETTLNLKLIGLLFGRTPEGSRALINTGGSNEAPFSTGMEVVRGVTLEQIFADRVILMRQGRPETLRLEKDAPAANVAAAPAASDLGDAVVLPQLGSVRDEICKTRPRPRPISGCNRRPRAAACRVIVFTRVATAHCSTRRGSSRGPGHRHQRHRAQRRQQGAVDAHRPFDRQ